MSNRHPIFVYGTLMTGQRANYMLSSARYAGKCLLRDYAMYNLGSYPGIKPMEGSLVRGELYYVDGETLAQMDEYEGNGSLYHRTDVTVTAGGRNYPAQAYIYGYPVTGYPRMDTPWGAPAEDWDEV